MPDEHTTDPHAAALADALARIIRQRYDQCPPGKWPMEDSLAEFILEHATGFGLAVIQLPEPEGLFDSPVPAVRFCGLAMGGYGSLEDLSKDEATVELIVPAQMVSGRSINDFNSQEGRYRFAAALLAAAEAVTA